MIDIHCHILPGIDDGAPDLRTSIEMARLAYADGIRHVIATPHFNNNYYIPHETVNRLVREVQQALDREGIPVTVHSGSELRLESAEFVYRHGEAGNFCYLGGRPEFVLMEQSWTSYNPDTLAVVDWFGEQGTKVVLPHPERHMFFREQPKLLENLIAAGVWTQVSVDSLLGKNSPDAQKFAEWLIDRDYAHTLATDAHNLHRKPNLSLGFKIVRERAGEARAAELQLRAEQIIGIV